MEPWEQDEVIQPAAKQQPQTTAAPWGADEVVQQHPAEAPVISDAPQDAGSRSDAPDAVEQYRVQFQSLINDPTATTAQIVAFMRRNGINDVPSETMAQLSARERSIQNYGTYAGQAVVDQGQVEPQQNVSGLEAFGQGIGQGLTFGALDEIGAGIGAATNAVAGVFGGGTDESMADYYRRVRDENRAGLHNAEDQHGVLYGAGQVAGAIPGALVGGASTGAALAGRAALEGAAYGAGASEGQNVSDVASDAAVGGVAGSLGAGALNRISAMISPTVAPLVAKLLGQGVELTPTKILKSGGGLSRSIGTAVDGIAGRGLVAGAARREAEGRALSGVEQIVARQDAAVEAARAAGLNATPRHPDFINEARALVKPPKEASQADMLANILLGYGTSGGTLAADLGLATLYSKPGAAITNNLLTGRQGPVPKSLRNITTKLSPLAGRAAAINTTEFED